MGIDFCLNGEFVLGVESWINLLFLCIRESLIDVQYLCCELNVDEVIEVDDVLCFMDQFMQLSMFFQDYFCINENVKMYFNLMIGIGFFYGLQGNNQVFCNIYCFDFYYWVDIGFSFLLFDDKCRVKWFNYFL